MTKIRELLIATVDDLAATGDTHGLDALASDLRRAAQGIEYRGAAVSSRLNGSIDRAIRLEAAADAALGKIGHGEKEGKETDKNRA